MSKSEDKAIIIQDDDVKFKAIEKMKQALKKVATEEAEVIEEEKEIRQSSVETKKKESNNKIKKKETLRDDEGAPMLSRVKVYSPFQVYYNNPAYSVTAVNGTGKFDILPGHKNFLTLLLPGEVIVRGKRDEEKLKIDRGIMHVHEDEVTVFLDV